jgi:hypothetical protein
MPSIDFCSVNNPAATAKFTQWLKLNLEFGKVSLLVSMSKFKLDNKFFSADLPYNQLLYRGNPKSRLLCFCSFDDKKAGD